MIFNHYNINIKISKKELARMNETLEQFITRTMEERKVKRQEERARLQAEWAEQDREQEEFNKEFERLIERKQRGE
jgi:replication fork clamp-binding protein CrfC